MKPELWQVAKAETNTSIRAQSETSCPLCCRFVSPLNDGHTIAFPFVDPLVRKSSLDMIWSAQDRIIGAFQNSRSMLQVSRVFSLPREEFYYGMNQF
jgi:hypothetical protein